MPLRRFDSSPPRRPVSSSVCRAAGNAGAARSVVAMAQRPKWWHMLQAGKREAILAADLYNRTAVERSLEGYVVHMHLAWLYMLQAHFLKTGVDFRYRQDDGRTFERVDGEIKTWELARCVREQFPDESNAARQNVEFFIKLRNRIEHRYEQLIATVVAGKSQAFLMNFEETLCQLFGSKEGLADSPWTTRSSSSRSTATPTSASTGAGAATSASSSEPPTRQPDDGTAHGRPAMQPRDALRSRRTPGHERDTHRALSIMIAFCTRPIEPGVAQIMRDELIVTWSPASPDDQGEPRLRFERSYELTHPDSEYDWSDTVDFTLAYPPSDATRAAGDQVVFRAPAATCPGGQLAPEPYPIASFIDLPTAHEIEARMRSAGFGALLH